MPAYDNEGATISMEDVRTGDPHVTISTISEEVAMRRNRMLKTQKSTVSSRQEQAVCVRRAYKKYGTTKNPNIILDGLNMTVPKGTIYGLLGASGCGKTTLLSCIVGRRRLNSGEIWVLGGKPGSRGSGVPGPRIGYMPQEVAVFGEFTIRETFIYFGWISGLSTEAIEMRTDFLVNLLQLPNVSKHVKNLSGGQQRRVSLAAALLHEPELLILDEPTVGVDPVLRQSIWDHLVDITKGSRTTVIITTHYIDETKQANVIGLMRGGRFLAEEAPTELIRRYQADSLEQVFLKLSVLQNKGKRRRSSILADIIDKVELPSTQNPSAIDIEEAEIGEISGEFGDNVSMSSRSRGIVTELRSPLDALPPEEQKPVDYIEKIKPMKWHHMKALIWKNAMGLLRNFSALAFILGLPVVQMILFCLAIGHYPVGLPIAVVNYETNNSLELCNYDKTICPQNEEYEWNFTLFSCRYFDALKERQDNFIYYNTAEEAMYASEHGKVRVVLIIPANFSACLGERLTDARNIDDFSLTNSAIETYIDDTDRHVEWMLSRDISLAFADTVEKLANVCSLPDRSLSIPIHFHDPVFGVENPNFTDFAAPGVIITIIFFLAVALTSGSMLAERNEGILERSLVSGITGTEILVSHLVVQTVVMIIQSIAVLLIAFVFFELSHRGPIGWVVFLVFLCGLCGMTFGFVVSCLCDTDRTATYLALGSFLPLVMLCGIIWPIEAMHISLQYISYILPLTKTTEAFRSMLQRGWPITSPTVYAGFTSISIWIVIYLITSILLLKFKKG